MTRATRIARPSSNIRHQLNARLEDREQGKDLVEWLNSLDQVLAKESAPKTHPDPTKSK